MTNTLKGHFLVPTTNNPDTGLWFIFHHEAEGLLAIDLTKPHPDIPYRHFESVLEGEDNKPRSERIVLLGGPMQPDTSMIVLHNDLHAVGDNHVINDDFRFLSYRFVLLPGHPPQITKADDTPTRINMQGGGDFLITMGFRLFDMDALEKELQDWQWTILPATPDIVFFTPHKERLEKARRSIN